MDYKIKSYVMLSIIFVLGFLSGWLIKDLVTESPLQQIRNFRERGGIAVRLEKVLELTDKQKKEIRPILDKFDKRFSEQMKPKINEVNKIIDSLKIAIEPYLTKEQKLKLKKEFMFPIQPNDRKNGPEFEKPF